MKLVRNRSRRPLKVRLAGGKVLHLGPAKTGQISDDAVLRASVRELVESGELEILGDGHVDTPASSPVSRGESTQGHHSPSVVFRKGDR